MFRRWLGLAILGVVALTSLPGVGRAQSASKDDVLALSRWIDNYLERRWKALNVTPAPLAEDAVYFRRLSLDLAGKIPELTQVHDFLGNPHPDKRWLWVEDYLRGEAFARHFANVWRTNLLGHSSNPQARFLALQFERWLKEQFEKDVPLDKLARQILTAPDGGSVSPGGGNALAFYAVNENKPENLAGAASRALLGVKIECAQCHAHPFAQWTKDQFWQFAAFFSGIQPNVRRIAAARLNPAPANPKAGREIKIPETDRVVKAKFLDGTEPAWQETSNPRQVLAEWVTSPKNPYFARAMADHVWAYFFGVSLLEPILEPSDDSDVTHEELLDELARQLIAHHFDVKFLVRAIVHTQAYQRSSGGPAVADKDDYHLFLRMPIRSLTPEQLFDSLAEATAYAQPPVINDPRFAFNPPNTPRGEFLNKFGTAERRYDPQTSILQALLLMNGKFLAERTKRERNPSLHTLATQRTSTARKVQSLYFMVLSRPPRPEETERLVRYLDGGGPTGDPGRALEDVFWALLNSPEFVLNY